MQKKMVEDCRSRRQAFLPLAHAHARPESGREKWTNARSPRSRVVVPATCETGKPGHHRPDGPGHAQLACSRPVVARASRRSKSASRAPAQAARLRTSCASDRKWTDPDDPSPAQVPGPSAGHELYSRVHCIELIGAALTVPGPRPRPRPGPRPTSTIDGEYVWLLQRRVVCVCCFVPRLPKRPESPGSRVGRAPPFCASWEDSCRGHPKGPLLSTRPEKAFTRHRGCDIRRRGVENLSDGCGGCLMDVSSPDDDGAKDHTSTCQATVECTPPTSTADASAIEWFHPKSANAKGVLSLHPHTTGAGRWARRRAGEFGGF